jgi:hypothetical protein
MWEKGVFMAKLRGNKGRNMPEEGSAEAVFWGTKRQTRRKYSAEEKDR